MVWSPKFISLGYNQYVSRATFLSEASKGWSIVLPFLEASRDLYRFLATTPGCLPTAIFCTILTWNHTGTESSVSHFRLGGPLWLHWTHQVNFPSQGQLSSSLNSFLPHIYSVYNFKPPLLLMVTYSQVPGISTRALLGVSYSVYCTRVPARKQLREC